MKKKKNPYFALHLDSFENTKKVHLGFYYRDSEKIEIRHTYYNNGNQK